MAFTSTHPVDSYRPRQHLGTVEFRDRLSAALDCYYPNSSQELPHYDSVTVLLFIWEDDHHDLNCGNEVRRLRDVFERSYGYSTKVLEIPTGDTKKWMYDTVIQYGQGKTERDLVIVYYAGHGDYDPKVSPCLWGSAEREITIDHGFGQLSTPRTKIKQTWVDFRITRDYLCSQPCDVLFLLDCCHAGGTAIGARKELIAACAIETTTKAPGYHSFTSALVQELEHASTTGKYLTAAMLYRNLLQKTFDGTLDTSPVHAELSAESRTSILLIPGPSLQLATPASWPNNIPISVVLDVQLRDATTNVVEQLTSWLTKSKPYCVEKVKFRTSWNSRSRTVVFDIPVEVWYCLESHAAISFLDFRFPEPTPAEQASIRPTVRSNPAPQGGQGHRKGKSFSGFQRHYPGSENRPPQGYQ